MCSRSRSLWVKALRPRRAHRLLLVCWLVPAALLVPGAARASCTPTRQILGLHHWRYENCSVADLDQLRAAGPGGGALANNGADYCVPTSAMDWMVWLAKWGYIPTIPNFPLPIPPNKDWTDPTNFNQMSRYLKLMGAFMGTNPTGGTNGDGLVNGVDAWLALNAIKGHTTPVPGVVKVFQQVQNYDPDPNAMGEDAAAGGLVMVNIGFYDSSGNRTGGHEVVLQQGSNNGNDGNVVVDVMDPNDPRQEDHVQSPFTPEQWNIYPLSAGGWGVVTGPPGVDYGIPRYEGYSAIEPELVFSSDAPTMIADRPFSFTEATDHPRQAQRFKLPGGQPVLDFAIAPEGFQEPFVQAGNNQIWQVNTLDGTTTKLAAGPAGAAHLTFGGPTQTLFVSGTRQIVALDRSGRAVASIKLTHPLDAVAFDDHAGRLVALSTAQRRLYFFSRTLHRQGSIAVPAGFLAGRRAASIAVSKTGAIWIHRDGQGAMTVINPLASTRLRFRTVKLVGVAQPRGLAIDDHNHLFVDVAGHLVELLPSGRPVTNSIFAGMPASSIVHVSRNYSNAPANAQFQ
jgi:hypothetical protein